MTHTIQAIAWTLIHFCWQAAAVAVLYRLISMAFARKTSQTRYVLAVSALLLMLACACRNLCMGTAIWSGGIVGIGNQRVGRSISDSNRRISADYDAWVRSSADPGL